MTRERLTGLDGLRGLAALYVVVNHVFLRAFPGYPVDRAPFWAGWLIYGRFAVVVFIVLSGFSLALSPARHGWQLGGLSGFAHRRARRILPAYWAALAFSLAVAWLLVAQPGRGMPDARSVIVNGLLVQNVVGARSPNAAFWSMAVEAQLYLVFPLLLLMVRRWGAVVMLAIVTLVVVTVGIVGPRVPHVHVFLIQSAPDLAALFAVGVVSAGIVSASPARRAWPWGRLAAVAAAPVVATIWWQGSVWTLDHLFWVDLALGPAVACLLASLATAPRGGRAPMRRLLDARPIRTLGASSYSLYLTHAPIVAVVSQLLVAGRVRPGVPAFVASLALVLPLAIGFARVFAAVFERPLRQQPPRGGAGMSPSAWAWVRRAVAVATLAGLVWRLGTGPFLQGVGTIDAPSLMAAAGLAVLTTVCCAWRWTIVAGGLGLRLSLPAAVAAYYRSLFLNVTLPGGVVGDVHRGVSHGQAARDVGRGLRAVIWERSCGQVVQALVTIVVLLALPSPVRSSMPLIAAAVLVAAVGLGLVTRTRRGGARSAWARLRRAAATDLREVLLARRAWPGIALSSALVVGGHALTFLIAARTAGVTAPPARILPLALLVMLAMVLPSVGGWGPREGVAAWAFGAAGLGVQRGVATAVVYGVMVFVASLPGAVVLGVAWFEEARRPGRTALPLPEGPAHA